MIQRLLACLRRPPAIPADPVIAEHDCRYCSAPAVGVLRRVTGKPSAWIFYCPAHIGLAVEALGLRDRLARRRRER